MSKDKYVRRPDTTTITTRRTLVVISPLSLTPASDEDEDEDEKDDVEGKAVEKELQMLR
ncbi:hypothetical protein FRC15_002786 [Serendipita sp. 397]|nr:hypothetical protein FRC15_002786 [Serendipita sp. 397]